MMLFLSRLLRLAETQSKAPFHGAPPGGGYGQPQSKQTTTALMAPTDPSDSAVLPFAASEDGMGCPTTPPGAAGPPRPRAHRRFSQVSLADSDESGHEYEEMAPLVRNKSKLASGGARTVSSVVVWVLQCMGCAPGSRTLIGMAIYAVVLYSFFLLAAHLSFATLSVIFSHKVTATSSQILPCHPPWRQPRGKLMVF